MDQNYKMEISFKSGVSEKLEKAMTDKILSLAKKRGFEAEYRDKMIFIKGKGGENELANMGVIISTLRKTDWFKENVGYWIFYDSEGGAEDMIKRYHF